MSQFRLVAGLFFWGLAGSCYAVDFVSVKTPYAVLYDAPKADAKKKFVISRFMPLEQVVTLDDWVKVRDNKGEMSWVEKKALDEKRYVFALDPVVKAYAEPNEQSNLIFELQQQVAVEWLQSTGDGWVKVRHADGETAYVRSSQVWGD